ncbi:MAG TPA: hypothetical protein VFG83_10110, partial [Kofleriaceae bacterium]|nr:hypothetical protein [Kofleriaceae bacterium]
MRSDIYRTIAQDQAKAAGDAANAATAPVAEALRREAAEIGMEAISAIVMPIQDSVPATVQASKEQLAKAGKGTRDHAHQSTEQGHASLSAAHGQATAEIEGHKQRSTAAVTGKGRSLMASIEQLCESLKRQLDKQAVLGSNECARKVEVIKEQLAEAHTPEQAAELWPLLSGENGAFSIIDTLEVDAQAAGDGLDTICREGLAGLDVFVADQDGAVAAAVTEDIAQIRAATQRMTQHTSASSNALVARIRGISDMFLRDARRGIAGSREKGSALEGAVRQHATDRKAMLLASVNEAKAQATEVLTGMLAKIPEQVQSSGDSELEVKKAGLQDKANRLRKAMAVAGTEEGDIHVLFAECGYGEIEALEATYNAQFQERADDGMTPLRYDLADEMSGEELEAAMAFLRHDRHRAIELALDNANGCVDTEEDIARSLLKACSDEDIEYLNTAGKDTVEALCYALSDTDLDVVTTYLDTSLSRDERETRVVAIEIYEHSAGKWGTDEDEVNDRLAAANTPEKRRALRDAYNRYVDDRRLIRNLNGTLRDSRKARMQTGEDHLAEMIDSELSGYEKTTSQQLAKNQRNSTAIDASKLLEGGDEKTFEALEGKSYEESGTSYASQHKALENELKNADGDQKKLAARAKLEALEENRRQALDQQVQTVSGGDETSVQEVLQKRLRLATLVAHQNGAAKGISELGKSGEQLAEDIPDCDELLAGKCAWDPTLPKLSYLISMRKLKQGYAEPELMLMYALKGADNKVAIIK